MSSIIEDDDSVVPAACQDRNHSPSMFISIPPGKRLRHTCPTCGKVTIIRAADVSWVGMPAPSGMGMQVSSFIAAIERPPVFNPGNQPHG